MGASQWRGALKCLQASGLLGMALLEAAQAQAQVSWIACLQSQASQEHVLEQFIMQHDIWTYSLVEHDVDPEPGRQAHCVAVRSVRQSPRSG